MLKSLKFVFLILMCVGLSVSVVAKESEEMLEKEVGHVFAMPAHTELAPSQRLHLILLGVDDVAAASAFYEHPGWQKSPTGHAGYFKDPDGYLFEVDYEKPWVLDDEQRLVVDKLNP